MGKHDTLSEYPLTSANDNWRVKVRFRSLLSPRRAGMMFFAPHCNGFRMTCQTKPCTESLMPATQSSESNDINILDLKR